MKRASPLARFLSPSISSGRSAALSGCVVPSSPVYPCSRHQTQSRIYSNVAINSQNIGFIGLGNMGSHMATHLLNAGHSLYVHDRNEEAMQALAVKGASIARSPLELADESDVVITMLPASSHVEEVYTGPKGLLCKADGIRPSLLIDCSTIDPQTSRVLAGMVRNCRLVPNARNIGSGIPIMLDAPVSGGVVGARAATLTFMVGGPEEGLNAASPLLNTMGKRIVHCGGSGNGAAAKVCNNLAMAISMAGVSEGLVLGQRLGIDALTLTKIFNTSSARCWSSDTYNPVPGVMDGVPASSNYKGGFSCQLLAKDLGLALLAAEETGTAVPLSVQVHEMYTTLCKNGHNQEDFSSIFRHTYHGQPQPSAEEITTVIDPLAEK